MAVYPIPNQAIDLSTQDSIYCNQLGQRYYQTMPRTGCSEFEVRLGEETGLEIFTNPDFDNLLVDPDGWEWDLVNVTNDPILAPSGSIWQEVGLIVGRYYKICVEITQISDGQALCIIPQGSTVFETQNCFNKKGVHCAYFYAVGTTETFYFTATGATGTITLERAELKEISIPVVQIRTCEDVVVGVSPTVEIYKDFAKISYCWIGIQAGCYKICVSPVPETGLDIFGGANLIATEGGRPIILETLTAIKLTGGTRAPLTWIP